MIIYLLNKVPSSVIAVEQFLNRNVNGFIERFHLLSRNKAVYVELMEDELDGRVGNGL